MKLCKQDHQMNFQEHPLLFLVRDQYSIQNRKVYSKLGFKHLNCHAGVFNRLKGVPWRNGYGVRLAIGRSTVRFPLCERS